MIQQVKQKPGHSRVAVLLTDVIIETGVAHGGSLMLSASMFELLGRGKVIGVDRAIRQHHALAERIRLIEASSTDAEVADIVREECGGASSVMVFLDSDHAHQHVFREPELYAPLVTRGSYAVVFDTGIEGLPDGTFSDRPRGKGIIPKPQSINSWTHTQSPQSIGKSSPD